MTAATHVTFTIGGQAMSQVEGSELSTNAVAYDGATQGAEDAVVALEGATRRRQGKGWTYDVVATLAAAEVIRDYFATQAEIHLGESETELRADGRAYQVVADRIAKVIAADPTPPNGGAPTRTAKIEDEVWDPALAIAKERGDSLSALWRDALVRYTKKHGGAA